MTDSKLPPMTADEVASISVLWEQTTAAMIRALKTGMGEWHTCPHCAPPQGRVGTGCGACGGLGMVWRLTDYGHYILDSRKGEG